MSTISELFSARYGETVEPPSIPWNQTLETLLTHKSVRQYLSNPLPEGALELLVAAAQSAASSSNLQVWSVVAVTSTERKQRLAELARLPNQSGIQQHIVDAPLFLVWLADLDRLRTLLEAQGISTEQIGQLELFLVAVVDVALAAQNAVVAAESKGWGTVYIGALRNRTDAVAAELKLPPGIFPAFGLCVGFPDPQTAVEVKPRLPQEVVLHHETYSTADPFQAIDRYDQIMTDFYNRQNMAVTGAWSKHSAERILARQASVGLQTPLRNALHTLGFDLT